MKYHFASDNTAGICPEVLAAWNRANAGYAASYGEDALTAAAAALFREVFATDCEVFFVFNGTAANSLALAALGQPYHSVITHESAHIETDECGAPEFFSNGMKILLTTGKDGKLDVGEVERTITKRSDIHYPRPKVLSFTQATERGTVYTTAEIAAICALAKKYDLSVHMDGARFANAAATLGASPAALTWEAGVDVLCFGGTKLGAGIGEAVIFFNRAKAQEFDYRCKQTGQLASKMRYMAAAWLALLKDGLWLKYARHANGCARLLAEKLKSFEEIKILYPVEANAVFVEMPPTAHAALKEKGWHYYTFIGGGGARLMCSWQTQEAEIKAFAADVGEVLASKPSF